MGSGSRDSNKLVKRIAGSEDSNKVERLAVNQAWSKWSSCFLLKMSK